MGARRVAATSGMLGLVVAASALAGAGIRNGTISGVLRGPDGNPVADAFVVARRESGTPPVIRSTRSDIDGRYYLHNMPLGEYFLGYSRVGFETVSSDQGTDPAGPLGAQVRAFVESGGHAVVPDVTLSALPSTSAAQLEVILQDGATGDRVTQGVVVVGSAATGGSNGTGSFSLNVVPRLDAEGNLLPLPVLVQADGYRVFQGEVTVAGGVGQAVSFTLQPRMVVLSGFVDLDPTLAPEQVQQIRVSVDGVPDELSQGRVLDSSGYFEVLVPASTSTLTRSFNLRFSLQGAQVTSLPNVVSPQAGSRTISSGVRVEAIKTEVAGQVVASDGGIPNGRIMEAVIVELGRGVPVNGGGFSLVGIPVGRPLTLRVTVQNPTTGQIEVGETVFTATDGGAGLPFQLAPIVTSPR